MRLGASQLIFFIYFLILRPITAIFADEAYQVDFHHVLLGSPQPHATFLRRPSSSSKASLLSTLSDRSVLGAVNPKDGSVIWRQQLSSGNGLLKASRKDGIVVSAVNGIIQAWDAAEGRLVWDWQGAEEIKALEVSESSGDDHGVYVLSQSEGGKAFVRKFSGQSGTLLWEHYDER